MLSPTFNFALQEFAHLEAKICFEAPLNEVSAPLNDGYFKWTVNGLGEAYGYWFKLKSTGAPFIVKTFVNVEGLDKELPIEWTIDASTLEIAMDVFSGLNIATSAITWKLGDT